MTTHVARDLLERAYAALERDSLTTPFHAERIAAWIGRVSLETFVIEVLAGHGIESAAAHMRSRLSCLRVLEPDLARDASTLWWGLSRCCHHHAYELAPSATEVKHHLDLLASRVQERLTAASDLAR